MKQKREQKLMLYILIFSALFIFIPGAMGFNMRYHYDIIRDVLAKDGFSPDAYSLALAGNSYTDLFQPNETSLLINADFCRQAQKLVDSLHCDDLFNPDLFAKYINKLIQNSHNAIALKVSQNDHLGLLMILGIDMHILSDFYAHSTWSELNLAGYTQVKDITYFEGVQKYPAQFKQAVDAYKLLTNPANQGLYTNGVTDKDWAGKSYFETSFRTAYKTAMQWLALVKYWVCEELGRADFWSALKNYGFPGDRSQLFTLTSYDEGTIRWMCIYGGAWGHNSRWSTTDILADDMPNVSGIGVTETQDWPFLGIEWFANCALLAAGMFQGTSSGNLEMVQDVTGLAAAVADPNHDNFGAKINVVITSLSPAALPEPDVGTRLMLNNALTCLADSLQNRYSQVRWFQAKITRACDLDTGSGLFNFNDEEFGGTSDYWVMWTVNGLPYSEAEYVDSSTPVTNWEVFIPIWDNSPVNVKVEMFESDPSDHHDERMDINPGSVFDLALAFDPLSLAAQPNGYYLESKGNDKNMKAQVNLGAKVMN